MSGNGTLESPIDLNSALTVNIITANDTIILLDGATTQGNTYTSSINGSANRPVNVIPNTGARPIIDGYITINGSYTEWHNVEFSYSGWTTRESEEIGGYPSDLPHNNNLVVGGTNIKLINCILHDLFSPSFYLGATNLELYGCVIYNNGWHAPDRGHGHGIYAANLLGIKKIVDCIVFHNYGYGIHNYTEETNLDNFYIEGNTCFRNGIENSFGYNNILMGGEIVAKSPTLKENMTYGANGCNVGYTAGATDVTLIDNYFPDGITKDTAEITIETGNYYDTAIGNEIFVRPNQYQDDRANVTIYNQAESNTIEVDLSTVTGLEVGDTVNVRNVQNYFVDIQELTLDANKKIIVNMQAANRTVIAPVGGTAPATTFPTFGCFVVEKA